MKSSLKEKAIELRKAGYSYSYIIDRIKVSRSTLSYWLSDIKYQPNKITSQVIGKARLAAIKTIQKNKLNSINSAKNEAADYLGSISKRDLFLLGLGIYIGEGTKTQNMVRIVNSDPRIIKLMLKWFREVCDLKDENFRLRLHIYPDTDESLALRHWTEQLNINKSLIQKSCIDYRKDKSRKGASKLPFGTAHLSVVSNGRKELGVYLFRKICGWIDGVLG